MGIKSSSNNFLRKWSIGLLVAAMLPLYFLVSPEMNSECEQQAMSEFAISQVAPGMKKKDIELIHGAGQLELESVSYGKTIKCTLTKELRPTLRVKYDKNDVAEIVYGSSLEKMGQPIYVESLELKGLGKPSRTPSAAISTGECDYESILLCYPRYGLEAKTVKGKIIEYRLYQI